MSMSRFLGGLVTLASSGLRRCGVGKTVTLASDFGAGSFAAGAMEAVARGISPLSPVVHLAHNVTPFCITEGATAALAAVMLQPGGIHVTVVDPGVGTARPRLAIRTKRGDILIGPDNGVLIPAAEMLGGIIEARAIEHPKLFYTPGGGVFYDSTSVYDGLHCFAPAAAHLANGFPFRKVGRVLRVDQLYSAPYPVQAPTSDGRTFQTVVVGRSVQGNVHLNITHRQLNDLRAAGVIKFRVHIGNEPLEVPLVRAFGEVPEGAAVAVAYIFGMATVAINCGNFAGKHRLSVGDTVLVEALAA